MTHSDSEAERIARLEAELARVKKERDIYKESVRSLLRTTDLFEMPTEAELQQCLTGPFGEPMADILAEYQKKIGPSA